MRKLQLALAAVCAIALLACGGPSSSLQAHVPQNKSATQTVFDMVSPSVLAVLNDDKALREEEARRSIGEVGSEAHAPKTVIDVSLRKDPTPHGTAFLVEGGLIITAAHVVLAPDHLKLTTKSGQTVDAELVRIDEVRDVAILKPKQPIKDVPEIKLLDGDIKVGRKVWALGHTGGGMWALQWGISEGISSGIVDLLGAKLVLFDAPVYPGFSGGPVITLDEEGKPRVIGVNHAILYTGGLTPIASISSGSSISDVKEVIAGTPLPLQAKLADFARAQASKTRAQLFITSSLSVHKDPQMLTTAAIVGNQRSIEAVNEIARVPVVAMLFGLAKGDHDIEFDIEDPEDKVVASLTRKVTVGEHDRVAFVSADFKFDPKVDGHYDIIAKLKGKQIGRTNVWIEDPNDDDQPIDEEHEEESVDADPFVDVVVASIGRDEPLMLMGIRSAWSEWHFPRRVGFTWFARGSRGWSGTNVAISAFVLDEKQSIVGRGVGCMRPEMRPEHPWSCMGTGGTPLLTREGRYDIVFTINDRPVALWPMEAVIRSDDPENSPLSRWLKEIKKHSAHKKPPPPAAKPSPKK